jgi:putative FmdB family regulatory protein
VPTYVYKCAECNLTFEKDQKITDDPTTECESALCDGKVHRVPQPVGVAYKGSGFHTTDYGPTGLKKSSYKEYVK